MRSKTLATDRKVVHPGRHGGNAIYSSGSSFGKGVDHVTGQRLMNWHRRPAKQVLEDLEVSAAGLSVAEILRRRAEHGPNILTTVKPRSLPGIFLAQFADFMILVLIVAAVISGVIGDLTDTVVIIAIVVLNAAIGFVQEYRAEQAIQALKAMAAPSAVVTRDGCTATVPAADLVPGDIVHLEAGCIVPADLRLVEAASLRINEAALTGESVPVEKTTDALSGEGDLPVGDRRNMAHKGTYVTYGRGLGVAIATGMRTEFGRKIGRAHV